jgi:hypothetical protein
VEGGPWFVARLMFAAGGEVSVPSVAQVLTPPPESVENVNVHMVARSAMEPQSHKAVPEEPQTGVVGVRLIFGDGGGRSAGNICVHEVRIMGHPPEKTSSSVGLPLVKQTPRNIELLTNDVFARWKADVWTGVTSHSVTNERSVVTTFKSDGSKLFRVVVDRITGEYSTEQLARWTEAAEPVAVGTKEVKRDEVLFKCCVAQSRSGKDLLRIPAERDHVYIDPAPVVSCADVAKAQVVEVDGKPAILVDLTDDGAARLLKLYKELPPEKHVVVVLDGRAISSDRVKVDIQPSAITLQLALPYSRERLVAMAHAISPKKHARTVAPFF